MDELKKYTEGTIVEKKITLPEKQAIRADIPNFADKLIEIADEERKFSYCPYSKFSVGAALLCMDGSVYTGCNVETAAFIGICAEKNALFKAVSEGKRGFLAIAVSGGAYEQPPKACTPCGSCRQALTEFVDPEEFAVIIRNEAGEIKSFTLSELLPYSFGPSNLM